jgi:hypothetical protein
MKHNALTWPPLEPALSILNVYCSVKNEFLKIIDKTQAIPTNV